MGNSFIFYKKGQGPFGDGTSRAERYERAKLAWLGIVADADAGDTRAKTLIKRDQDRALAMFRTKDASPSPADVQGVPILNNMSVQYGNGNHIGMELMPLSPVQQISGQYFEYDRRFRAQVPRAARSGRSEANERVTKRVKRTYACEPAEFQGHIGFDTVMNQVAPINEMFDLTEDVNSDLSLRREVKIAGVLGTAANYATANKTTLTAGIRWDDPGSNPIKDLRTATAKIWPGKGQTMLVGWCSTEVWNILSAHPDLLKLLNLQDRGLVSPAQFCEIFMLDGMMVSEARGDSANLGAAASYSRVWGNKFGICRVSKTPQLRNASFGFTFRWMASPMSAANGFIGNGVFAQQWYDPRKGPFGAFFYKSSYYEDYKIIAADTGYLIDTPVNGTF